MTDTKTALKKFEETVAHYERELERYDPEQLTRKPGEEEWSIGQMYMHLILSALNLHLANIDVCRTGAAAGDGSACMPGGGGTAAVTAGALSPASASVPGAGGHAASAAGAASTAWEAPAAAGKTERGQAVFAAGSFPPVAIRVPPSPQYTPQQPASKDEIVRGLRRVTARMRELEPALASIPAERTRLHPALGALNAVEWFQLIEMHYRHHLLQKERLDAFLGLKPAERASGSTDAGAGTAAGTVPAAGSRNAEDADSGFRLRGGVPLHL